MREQAILLRVAATPVSIVGDRQVEEEVPAAGGVLHVVEDLNVALSLSRPGYEAKLRAHPVSSPGSGGCCRCCSNLTPSHCSMLHNDHRTLATTAWTRSLNST
jgi:hypothetical protein